MTRQLIVVDCETTGLDPEKHWVLEVAAVNLTTDEELYFVPSLPANALVDADPIALQINRYFERGVWAKGAGSAEVESNAWGHLWQWLDGNTLAGSNPTFEAVMLVRAAHWPKRTPPWHYRLADLSAYAAGRLGIPPTELPGLDVVCQLLGVENSCPHSALGDARAAAECFRRLSTPAPHGGVVDRPAPPTPPVDAGAGHLNVYRTGYGAGTGYGAALREQLASGTTAGSCWCPEDPEK